MEFYDFLFYEAEAQRKVVIFNVEDLEPSDKQLENLIFEMEEHYFEDCNNEFQILFCIPRHIKSKRDYTDNSDFVLAYRIHRYLRQRFEDFSKVSLFSFIYISGKRIDDFQNVNDNEIHENHYGKNVSFDFPDFSTEEKEITPEEYPQFKEGLEEKIARCSNAYIRQIFSEVWQLYGPKEIPRLTETSEMNWFFHPNIQEQLEKLSFKEEALLSLHIDTDDFAGVKNQQIKATLTLINAVINAEHPIEQKDLVLSDSDLQHYANSIADYQKRLKHSYKQNLREKEFSYTYRDPGYAIEECANHYKEYNSKVYNAISSGDPKIFTDTIAAFKGKAIKDEARWNDTYQKILDHIELADGYLSEYMDKMTLAFAESEYKPDTIRVDENTIGTTLKELEVDFKKKNDDFFDICSSSDVEYKTTLEARNELTALNRRIKNILRYEKLQKVLPFVLTILFALLTFIIPYSVSETQVFSTFNGWIIWLITNAAFVLLTLLGAVAVHLYFDYKKKKLYRQVIKTCNKFFKAYLLIAQKYAEKLITIARIEQISTKRDFLKGAQEEFKLEEKKLSYHKNCISRISKGLTYFNNLANANDSYDFSRQSSFPGINLEKDEKRNGYYYPK